LAVSADVARRRDARGIGHKIQDLAADAKQTPTIEFYLPRSERALEQTYP
jgi:hypothetical protein